MIHSILKAGTTTPAEDINTFVKISLCPIITITRHRKSLERDDKWKKEKQLHLTGITAL